MRNMHDIRGPGLARLKQGAAADLRFAICGARLCRPRPAAARPKLPAPSSYHALRLVFDTAALRSLRSQIVNIANRKS